MVILGSVLAGNPLVRAHGPVDHSAWDRLLHRYVRDGLVDYHGMNQERQALEDYLTMLADAHVDRLPSTAHQLAFWVNLYNACVVQGILDHYPLDSVKQVQGFFTTPRCRVGGESLSIDEVGSRGHAVGGLRVHFAIVCASLGCPRLRAEAYDAQRLDEQLADQARRYFADPQRGLRIDDGSRTVWLSKIIHWNRDDFQQPKALFGMLTTGVDLPRLADVLAPYLEPSVAARLRGGRWQTRILPYDWSLNDTEQDKTGGKP